MFLAPSGPVQAFQLLTPQIYLFGFTVLVQITHTFAFLYNTHTFNCSSFPYLNLQSLEPNHHSAIQKATYPQGNSLYHDSTTTVLLQPIRFLSGKYYFCVLWSVLNCACRWCPLEVLQFIIVAREISVSQHLRPTEPDKAPAFPAVAAADLKLKKRQLHQHGRADPHHMVA